MLELPETPMIPCNSYAAPPLEQAEVVNLGNTMLKDDASQPAARR
jgi:hypothetical protein